MSQHTSPAATRGIANEVVRNTFWVYISYFSGKGMVLIATYVLSFLLTPAHYGIVGMALLFISYLDVFSDFGAGSALIARREDPEEAANAAFLVSCVSALVLFALAWVTAPIVAGFFGEPQVVPVLRVLGFTFILGGLRSVPSSWMTRQLRFKASLVPDISSSATKGIVSIVLAFFGFGVWSLVWGQVASEAVALIVTLLKSGWRLTRKVSWKATRDITSFGIHIVIVGVLGQLMSNIDYVFVGRLFGSAALGYYTLAYRLPDLLIKSINIAGRVAYPVLARASQDRASLLRAYAGYLQYSSIFVFPIGVGLCLVADPFVRVFFASRWYPMIPMLQAISIALAISSVGHFPGVIYKAIGRPDILNKLAFIKVIYIVGFLALGSWLGGPLGVALGQIPVGICNMLLDSVVISRVLAFRMRSTFRALAPAALGVLVMAAVLVPLLMIHWSNLIIQLILMVVLGGCAYAATVWVVNCEAVTQARTMLRAASGR